MKSVHKKVKPIEWLNQSKEKVQYKGTFVSKASAVCHKLRAYKANFSTLCKKVKNHFKNVHEKVSLFVNVKPYSCYVSVNVFPSNYFNFSNKFSCFPIF